ncbi:putative serine/threonine-protein phosphatase 4 regulatory subunit 2-B [Apostichopus japonicus]|uniref:Putative serine/threonine-protein phosphatase 4 regulatory subunit 2-B n=1 Tax=Stichopus japonicus TaxID=307972 RepID=A0A2G8L135_STIJA|nr:putative serine/threonine-protein phosphatase 4 regulatory subunit 2-B [Apostichopus japonicus]
MRSFAEKPVKEIPADLEKLLNSIAVTGRATYPWGKVKLLLAQKLENVIEEYMTENPDESVPLLPNVENVSFADMKQRLLTNIGKFNDAPFTIQRICELLVSPKKYYMQRDKFMRGIEKNILIVTTVTPTGKRITSLFEGSKGTPMVNGILSENNIPNGTQSKDSQFRVPSSPSAAKQQPSSSEGITSTSKELPQTEPSEEPAAKRVKLEELPDQGKEISTTPSTSEDRLPASEKEVSSEDAGSDSSSSSTNGYSSDSQSSSEAMEAQGSTDRLQDQSSSEEMEVQSTSGATEEQEPTSQGLNSESTDQKDEVQSSKEETNVPSSSQVTEAPSQEEETNEAIAAERPTEEDDSGK